MYRYFFKYILDFLLAFMGFILLFPVFLIVSLLLIINNKGRLFFFQKRPGKNEKIFKVIKFKTMNDRKDKNGNLLSDEIRLTSLGKFIRKTSLDELPQLLNVLKGDMSLVGPRPLLPEYLSLYSIEQQKRHKVKPGITGWAQVNGRNTISWQEKFEHDIWYVQNISFILDLKIIFLTFKKVLIAEGISEKNQATTTKFRSNNIKE